LPAVQAASSNADLGQVIEPNVDQIDIQPKPKQNVPTVSVSLANSSSLSLAPIEQVESSSGSGSGSVTAQRPQVQSSQPSQPQPTNLVQSVSNTSDLPAVNTPGNPNTSASLTIDSTQPVAVKLETDNTNIEQLKHRLQELEDKVQTLTSQINHLSETKTAALIPDRVSIAPLSRPERHRTRPYIKTSHTQTVVQTVIQPQLHTTSISSNAASEQLAAPSAPKLGHQLLSIDMWNGTPSVVMASGLPGDTRTRVLRPGDTLNGVTLRWADPSQGSATFVSNGREFTLSTREGN
jgi:hypothetical protein